MHNNNNTLNGLSGWAHEHFQIKYMQIDFQLVLSNAQYNGH